MNDAERRALRDFLESPSLSPFDAELRLRDLLEQICDNAYAAGAEAGYQRGFNVGWNQACVCASENLPEEKQTEWLEREAGEPGEPDLLDVDSVRFDADERDMFAGVVA